MGRWTVLFLGAVLMVACDSPTIPLAGATGRAGEFIVVMNDREWKSAAGDTVFNVLSHHVYGLPQAEPMFNVIHVKSSAFTRIFQTHRNILVANIGKEFKPRVELKTDVWATPQIVIEIDAPTVDQFVDIFDKNTRQIVDHVLKKESERVLKSYNAQLNTEVVKQVQTKFNLKLTIPQGYNVVREEDDFLWIRHEDKDITQSVLIYSEAYEKDNTFSKEGMTETIDRFSKAYVPGPDPGSYMTTYLEYPPLFEEKSISGRYASKLRGLWNVNGALMGGPFVSYAFLDAAEKRVYYLYGFVYAPGKNKRNYLRQVDAILNSADLK